MISAFHTHLQAPEAFSHGQPVENERKPPGSFHSLPRAGGEPPAACGRLSVSRVLEVGLSGTAGLDGQGQGQGEGEAAPLASQSRFALGRWAGLSLGWVQGSLLRRPLLGALLSPDFYLSIR